MRPLNPSEEEQNLIDCKYPSETQLELRRSNDNEKMHFKFDRVLSPECCQKEVYECAA